MTLPHLTGSAKCTTTYSYCFFQAEDCLQHIDSTQSSCTPCCRVRGCEGTSTVKACKNIPHDDICPHHTTGCPLEDLLTIWETKREKKNCLVDEK